MFILIAGFFLADKYRKNSLSGRAGKVGVTDCEAGGSRPLDWDYIDPKDADRKTADCVPVKIFNEDVVAEKYRYLLKPQ